MNTRGVILGTEWPRRHRVVPAWTDYVMMAISAFLLHDGMLGLAFFAVMISTPKIPVGEHGVYGITEGQDVQEIEKPKTKRHVSEKKDLIHE